MAGWRGEEAEAGGRLGRSSPGPVPAAAATDGTTALNHAVGAWLVVLQQSRLMMVVLC